MKPSTSTLVGGLTLAVLVHALPAAAQDPGPAPTDPVLWACYQPNSGIVYRVNAPDDPGGNPHLKDACSGAEHVLFSWSDARGGDHGELSGLGDDDHPRYLLVDGTRALTGDLAAGDNKLTGLAAATESGDAVRFDEAVLDGDAAGGDLSGAYPDPSVAALRGQPLSGAAPSAGQLLGWDGAAWTPTDAQSVVDDHGGLGGLDDDDHGQYLLTTGVRESQGFAVTGSVGSGVIPFEGTAARLMWHPAKAAFRVGFAQEQWDDARTGRFSFATGNLTEANGQFAVAMGTGTVASGEGALTVGRATRATGESSLAAGRDTEASGPRSVAMGLLTVASGQQSTALGESTRASGARSLAMGSATRAEGDNSVALGRGTTASGFAALAAGGFSPSGRPTVASGDFSLALGSGARASGSSALAIGLATEASGTAAFAGGGSSTAAGSASLAFGTGVSTGSGSRNSVVLGRDAETEHEGSFVFGDRSVASTTVRTTRANQFLVRADGGVTFFSSEDLSTGVRLFSGSGSWSSLSDRNAKENVRPEDPEAVLRAVADLPVSSWNYKAQDASIRHVGPMAQDFHAAFGLGDGDSTINTVDIDGINMLAIQALERRTREIVRLEARLAETESRLRELEAALRTLTAQVGPGTR